MRDFLNAIDIFNNPDVPNVVGVMDFVRALGSEVSSIRKQSSIPESYPLISLNLFIGDDYYELFDEMWFTMSGSSWYYREFMKDIFNVSQVDFDFFSDWNAVSNGITTEVSLDFKKAGPILGKSTKIVANAIRNKNYSFKNNDLIIDGEVLDPDFYTVKTVLTDNADSSVRVIGPSSFIVLDTRLGFGLPLYRASRLVRQINNQRKNSGKGVSDIITPIVLDTAENIQFYRKHEDYILKNTKSDSIVYHEVLSSDIITLPVCD